MGDTLAANRPLRVGLNLLFLGPHAGGVGRYARELAAAMRALEPATALTVFLAADAPADLTSAPWMTGIRLVRLPRPTGSRLVSLGQYLALPALAAGLRLDVLHSPANSGPVVTPGVASVVSVMDLIWLRHADDWDPDPRVQRAMRCLVGHSVRHADRVLTISHAAAADITAGLGVAPERIAVTPLGVHPAGGTAAAGLDALRRRLGLGDARVLLCVAQKRPYKNQERLVRALTTLPPDVVAVMPGARTAYEEKLRALAAELSVTDRVRFPNWVSDAELASLYELSAGFVLPSLTEGFGLPVLEAMARGLPVACADIPALREVAGDAALRFDPRDQAEADTALRRLLNDGDLRLELAACGRKRAAHFTWAQTARATLRAYREAISGRV